MADDPIHTARQHPLQLLEEHEGSLLYTDTLGRQRVRVTGILSVFTFHDPVTNALATGLTVNGYLPAATTALAGVYVLNPKLKVAVDGMYELLRDLVGTIGKPPAA